MTNTKNESARAHRSIPADAGEPAHPLRPAIEPDGQASRPLDPEILSAIAALPYLRDYDGGIYRDLDIALTLDYMLRRFVLPLSRHVDIGAATLLDCAAGFGWLSLAYLRAGGARAILVDPDPRRLDAARDIVARLELASRCEFRQARLQDIDDGAEQVDIVASIETLEHVGRENIAASVRAVARTAKQAVLLTTPNFIFPIVAHDTALPLAHWLPAAPRARYAAMAGRSHLDRGNAFLRPWDLRPLASKFKPVSRFQTFASLAEYDRFYPNYMPYGPMENQRHRARPRLGQRAMHIALAATLGPWSFALAPNLASIWLRRA